MKKLKHYTNGQKSVDLDIKIENGRLSIVGWAYTGEKLLKSEKNLISGGQCIDEARDLVPEKLLEIWERWHLNDLRAGTPAQEQALREVKHTFSRLDWYTDACNYLSSIDLLIDNGYKYGTAWLTEELPQDVIDYLEAL